MYYANFLVLTYFLIISSIIPQTMEPTIYYKFNVRDFNNSPVSNAKINILEEKKTTNNLLFTDISGSAVGSFKIKKTGVVSKVIYNGFLKYSVEKEGFCIFEEEKRLVLEPSELKDTLRINIFLNSPRPVKHSFAIKVVNSNQKPIEGARIELRASMPSVKDSNLVLITDSTGRAGNLFTYYNPKYQCNDHLRSKAITSVSYSIQKEGFYKKFNGASIGLGDNKEEIIILWKPEDYFDENFFSSKKYSKLVQLTYNFLNYILIESYLRDCSLDYGSIAVQTFKTKNYLKMHLTGNTTYNSIKLNTYQVGIKVFDEVIRKLLNPLNDNLGVNSQIDGFLIAVKTETKNFINEGERPKNLLFAFYLPKTEVMRYKEKDISGQQLIDRSIVLLNDERIDLKLQ